MKISFVGDIVCRNFDSTKFTLNNIESFKDNDIIVGNLEGPIFDEDYTCVKNNGIGLYSTNAVIKLLNYFNIDSLFIGNNHINDFNSSIKNTTNKLKNENKHYCGAGENITEANQAISYNINNEKVLLYGFGWKNSGCKIATKYKDGVNPFEYKHIISTLKSARKLNPDTLIIFMFNWNYDMEILPHPAYRRLSQELIDNGLDAIVGYHPHIVQGIEIYKDKPIVYGMGNWYIPQEVYCGKRVLFPNLCNTQVKIQLIFKKREFQNIILEWYEFNKNTNTLKYKSTEELNISETIEKLTPFKNLSNKEYDVYFKKHRRNKKFMPIYYKLNSKYNFFKDIWHLFRQTIVNILINMKLKTKHTNK